MSDFLRGLPRLFPRPEQTIAGIGRLLRQGEVSCVDILNACLEQVDEWEPKVHAWVVLDREGAMEQARALDDELRSGHDRGRLHGIPIGIKDVLDVQGLPTACGAGRWADQIAREDDHGVRFLRDAGAVILGKTVTTPYAWIDPPPTRNPWDLERTPGGSSSGSAAAVACGMCYGAIGAQTGGSITRPASFCGIAGLKPDHTYSACFDPYPFAPSLDHVGPLARTVTDLRLLYVAMDPACPPPSRKQQRKNAPSSRRPPRLLRFRRFFDRRAENSMLFAFEVSLEALASRGARIVEADDPVDFEQVIKDHRLIMAAEAACVHFDEFDMCRYDYPPRITDLILEGRSYSALEYLRAKERQSCVQTTIMRLLRYDRYDAAITPATIGTAPDRSTTGDPAFNSPWSFTGLPTVSFPTSLAGDGMPVALQLVGTIHRDYELLQTARWCEKSVRTSQQ